MRADPDIQRINLLFTGDCLKYIELGEKLSLKISNWKNRSAEPELLAEAIREFSHLVHTLKGVSGMVKEGVLLSEKLHSLEDELLDSKKDWKNDWDAFSDRMNDVFQFGRDLLRGIEQSTNSTGTLSQGHWVELQDSQVSGRFFFNSGEWLDQIPLETINTASVCLYQGEWLPVLHFEGSAAPEVAFVYQSAEGKAVILARKYLGKISYDEARRKGAILSWNPFSDVARLAA